MQLLYDSATALLGIFFFLSGEMIRAQTGNNPYHSSTCEWLTKVQYIHTIEYTVVFTLYTMVYIYPREVETYVQIKTCI